MKITERLEFVAVWNGWTVDRELESLIEETSTGLALNRGERHRIGDGALAALMELWKCSATITHLSICFLKNGTNDF